MTSQVLAGDTILTTWVKTHSHHFVCWNVDDGHNLLQSLAMLVSIHNCECCQPVSIQYPRYQDSKRGNIKWKAVVELISSQHQNLEILEIEVKIGVVAYHHKLPPTKHIHLMSPC